MSTANYVASCILLVGGVVAYVKSGSVISLLVATAFSAIIAYAASRISHPSPKSKSLGLNLAIGTLSLQSANFTFALKRL